MGMEQVPSHVEDYLNARNHVRRQTGIDPPSLQASPNLENW
jgi:hypothetical protein